MCNDYEQHVGWADYRKVMQQLEFGIPTEQSEADLPQADDVRVNDVGPVMRVAGNGVELVPMTFGFPPENPSGGPVFNFKSEGRRFEKSSRCIIPGVLRVHRQALSEGEAPLCPEEGPVHGHRRLWRETDGKDPPAFTMLTIAPSADVEPYHDRQVAVLHPEDWTAWLYLTKLETELLRPLPEGSLEVETVRKGSD